MTISINQANNNLFKDFTQIINPQNRSVPPTPVQTDVISVNNEKKNEKHSAKNSFLSTLKDIGGHLFTDSLAPIISLGMLAGVAYIMRRPFENYTRLFNYSRAVKKPPETIFQSMKDANKYLKSLPSEIGKKVHAFREAVIHSDKSLDRMNGILVFVGPPGTGKTYSTERVFRWSQNFEKEAGILRIKLDDDNVSTVFDMLLEMQNGEFSRNIIKTLDKKLGAKVKTVLLEVDELETLTSQGISAEKIKKIFGQSATKNNNGRETAIYLVSTGNEIPKYWKENAAINSRLTKIDFPTPSVKQVLDIFIPDIERIFPSRKGSSEINETKQVLAENLEDYVFNYRSFKMTDFVALLKMNYEETPSLPKAVMTTVQEKMPIGEKLYKKSLKKSADEFSQKFAVLKAKSVPDGSPTAQQIAQQLRNISSKTQDNKIGCLDKIERLFEKIIPIETLAQTIAKNTHNPKAADSEFLTTLDSSIIRHIDENVDLFETKPADEVLEVCVKKALQSNNQPAVLTNNNVQSIYNETVDRLKDSVVGKITLPEFKKALSTSFNKLLETVEEKQDTDIFNKFTINTFVDNFNRSTTGLNL